MKILTLTPFSSVKEKWIVPHLRTHEVLQFKPSCGKEDLYRNVVNSLRGLRDTEEVWASWAPLDNQSIEGEGIFFYFPHDPPADPADTLNLCCLHFSKMLPHPNHSRLDMNIVNKGWGHLAGFEPRRI